MYLMDIIVLSLSVFSIKALITSSHEIKLISQGIKPFGLFVFAMIIPTIWFASYYAIDGGYNLSVITRLKTFGHLILLSFLGPFWVASVLALYTIMLWKRANRLVEQSELFSNSKGN